MDYLENYGPLVVLLFNVSGCIQGELRHPCPTECCMGMALRQHCATLALPKDRTLAFSIRGI